ncbi:MAG TPA: heme-binding beta-barrel domain-containing protein, partial [Spongiibacteraceae bacterium]
VNGSQVLYGLRYSSVMWPEQAIDPFHEETGYWLWDPRAQQVYCCFVVPRGVVVNAGANVAAEAKFFTLAADVGAEVYGLSSNPFLDAVYKTLHFEMTVKLLADGSMEYSQDTVLKMKNIGEVFHHTDCNSMRKVG